MLSCLPLLSNCGFWHPPPQGRSEGERRDTRMFCLDRSCYKMPTWFLKLTYSLTGIIWLPQGPLYHQCWGFLTCSSYKVVDSLFLITLPTTPAVPRVQKYVELIFCPFSSLLNRVSWEPRLVFLWGGPQWATGSNYLLFVLPALGV